MHRGLLLTSFVTCLARVAHFRDIIDSSKVLKAVVAIILNQESPRKLDILTSQRLQKGKDGLHARQKINEVGRGPNSCDKGLAEKGSLALASLGKVAHFVESAIAWKRAAIAQHLEMWRRDTHITAPYITESAEATWILERLPCHQPVSSVLELAGEQFTNLGGAIASLYEMHPAASWNADHMSNRNSQTACRRNLALASVKPTVGLQALTVMATLSPARSPNMYWAFVC